MAAERGGAAEVVVSEIICTAEKSWRKAADQFSENIDSASASEAEDMNFTIVSGNSKELRGIGTQVKGETMRFVPHLLSTWKSWTLHFTVF